MSSLVNQVIGLDLGGTKLLGGTRTADGGLVDLNWPTETSDSVGLITQIKRMVGALRDERELAGVALGVPAAVNPVSGQISLSPNVPLADVDNLARYLSAEISAPVVVENDVNLAAFGEAAVGAGRGKNSVVFVSLGTGIGMGTVIGGQLLRGARGQAGELGSSLIEGGQLEDFVGTAGILSRDPMRSTSVVDIFTRALSGEKNACNLLDETADITARALTGVLCSFDPDLLVIGGGIGTQSYFYDRLQAALKATSSVDFDMEKAALGAQAGMLGALEYAFNYNELK